MPINRENETPLVTVIIPIYNTEKYLRGSVESVIKQNYPNLSVILVDDGSPDGAPHLCDVLAAEYAQVSVIHKENGGLSSARNAGLDNAPADTKYVLFLDSDDKLTDGALAGLVKKAEETGADIVMPDRYNEIYEHTGETKTAFHFPKNCYLETPKQFVLEVIMGKGRAWRATAILYSNAVVQKYALRFPVGYTSEDIVFNLNLYLYANKIAFYPHSTLNNLKRSSSITTTFQAGFEKTIYYIDDCAREFIKKANLQSEIAEKKADALLCRNIVVYLFSIMSSKNTMSAQEKKAYAYRLLYNEKVQTALKQKHSVPYFESQKVRLAFGVIYRLLKHGHCKTVVMLLASIPR